MNLLANGHFPPLAPVPACAPPPRVLMVRVGGWENWVETVARHLAQDGFTVTTLVLRLAEVENQVAGTYGDMRRLEHHLEHSALGKACDQLRLGLRLRRLLKEESFDILYAVDSWTLPALYAATAGRFRWKGRPLVYHTFEWLEPGVHRRVHVRLERGACRTADLVVNIDRLRGRLQQLLYRLPHAPLWVRNSLSRVYPVPPYDPVRRGEMLDRFAPADALLAIIPSTASPERLTLESIRAFAHLPEHYRLVTLEGGGAYFRACRQEAAGLSGRVVFLPRMPFDRLMGYIASADVGAIFHDGQTSTGNYLCNPMRLTQFTACGIPFVAAALPTLEAEVYRHGLGVCCDAHDPRAIAAAVRELCEGRPPLEVRKRLVRQRFEEHLAFETRAAYLTEALREIARKRA